MIANEHLCYHGLWIGMIGIVVVVVVVVVDVTLLHCRS